MKLGLGTIGGVLCLWLFLYISTIFPYLGSASRSENLGPGVSLNAGSGNFGLSKMILFEGQTAFFDYKIDSTDAGAVRLDVRPFTTFGASENLKVIEGTGQGTVEFVVTKTGLYEFRHDFSLNGTSGRTEYQVTWGAR